MKKTFALVSLALRVGGRAQNPARRPGIWLLSLAACWALVFGAL